MCGVAGIIRGRTADVPVGVIGKMLAAISHRGPDDEGVVFLSREVEQWRVCAETEAHWSVALGSRRLSILDLSSSGHMPMTYREQLWIAYNGEVYNFVELRTELEKLGYSFRSSSDTEVILAAYSAWGTECFARFRGMWGLIIFDNQRNEVILCRDRLGIKPLYFWQGAGQIVIASEIKQFHRFPGFIPHLNMASTVEYLQTGYEEPERSFFRDVQVVPAGCWLRIPLSTLVPSTPVSYWFPERVAIMVTDADEAGKLFVNKLRESVRLHLRSDVPVGCALSGGMDSSAIAALVNECRNGQDAPLHTFSCVFPGDALNEQEYVEAMLAHIHAQPHYVIPCAEHFLSELDTFLYIHDEPVGSLSVYASYCIARLMREAGIPVTLNGQGGDELFAGYWQSYFLHLRALAGQGHIFSLLKHFAGTMLGQGNPHLLAQIPLMVRRYYARRQPATLIRLRPSVATAYTPMLEKVLALGEQAWRVAQIRTMTLPRLLKWDDRNSMAFSVEGRYPFLDHELIELCLSFAPQTLYHNGWTKWPLRLGMQKILPKKILYRRTKFGFEVPQDAWIADGLRAELQRWLRQERPLWEYVAPRDVQSLAGRCWRGKGREYGQTLFRLFVFDRWLELYNVVR